MQAVVDIPFVMTFPLPFGLNDPEPTASSLVSESLKASISLRRLATSGLESKVGGDTEENVQCCWSAFCEARTKDLTINRAVRKPAGCANTS